MPLKILDFPKSKLSDATIQKVATLSPNLQRLFMSLDESQPVQELTDQALQYFQNQPLTNCKRRCRSVKSSTPSRINLAASVLEQTWGPDGKQLVSGSRDKTTKICQSLPRACNLEEDLQ
ncbi:uncharacterized protein METZ01_LOCUS259639 [marine metagenome]|uniref:Uncharacterized protein n=1 Tax=marine metagenome TaxID=408172 RepID=A0A382J5E8_9ZZZZ